MLKLKNIVKSFPGHFEPILKGMDLELEVGEFCVIIGSNGSGKSTLMRSISGEYSIDKGQIIIDGQDIELSKRSKYIASVTQDINKGTIPEMTLLENMVLSDLRDKNASLRIYKSKKEEMSQRIAGLGMGLEKYLDQPLSMLSGGQIQMIATLMAITSNPKILLLDEHTSALDPNTQNILMEYSAKNIASSNITSIMITHKLDDAVKYGNRLIMLHKGRIVLDVKGRDKEKLDVDKLLKLFHKFEDVSQKGDVK